MNDPICTELRYLLYVYDAEFDGYMASLTPENIKKNTLNLKNKIDYYSKNFLDVIKKSEINIRIEEEYKKIKEWISNKIFNYIKVVSNYAIENNDKELLEILKIYKEKRSRPLSSSISKLKSQTTPYFAFDN